MPKLDFAMKQNALAATLFAALLFGAVGSVSAQSNQAPQTQKNAIMTNYAFQASNAKSQVMSFEDLKAITESSIREAVGSQLKTVSAEDVNQRLAGTFDALVSGKTVCFATPVSGLAAHTVTEQHSMNVQVRYEARPIGGILTVRVELVPVFCGIGSASRSIAFREMSQALDNLEEDGVGEVVAELSHQLGNDYASK
jgi:hypothetical protein